MRRPSSSNSCRTNDNVSRQAEVSHCCINFKHQDYLTRLGFKMYFMAMDGSDSTTCHVGNLPKDSALKVHQKLNALSYLLCD